MDKLKSLYVDMPYWRDPIKVDDFIVAVGKKQSNSVFQTCQYPEKSQVIEHPILTDSMRQDMHNNRGMPVLMAGISF